MRRQTQDHAACCEVVMASNLPQRYYGRSHSPAEESSQHCCSSHFPPAPVQASSSCPTTERHWIDESEVANSMAVALLVVSRRLHCYSQTPCQTELRHPCRSHPQSLGADAPCLPGTVKTHDGDAVFDSYSRVVRNNRGLEAQGVVVGREVR
jgi:hypothetical protein